MQKTVQIVIEIPYDVYKSCRNLKDSPYYDNSFRDTAIFAIGHGTVLPEQYGDLIDRDELLKNDVGKIMGFRECDIRNAHTILEGTVKK